MAIETPISRWMTRKFLAWQSEQEEKKTVTEFAQYLGVSRVNASRYLSGASEPEGENLLKIGQILGVEIYDLLKLPRPDPGLQLVIAAWGKLHDDEIAEYTRVAKCALERSSSNDSDKSVAPPDRKRAQ